MNNGKICVSVCAETAEEFKRNIKFARPKSDFIELRFDCLEQNQLEKVELDSAENYIFTYRPKEQGGKRNLSLREREKFWNSGKDFAAADFEEDIVQNAHHWHYQPIICSHHDFSGTASNLNEIYERFQSINADVIKIAVQADEITDSIAIWKLLERAKTENKQIIPIAMGEAGKWTRILGLANGAFLTYAALDTGKETASGQISITDLIETYRVKELNKKTEIYGIIGNPVSQSVSPEMHNAAFKFHNLNAVYIPFEVKNLEAFMRRMVKKETREIELNFKGFSVTIPHKQAIIKHLDFIDETARAVGSVNTVKIVNDKFYGFNTDAIGFIEPLLNVYGELKNVKVAVLGAGGAARAAIYALKEQDADVTLFVRNLEKARILAEEFQIEAKELPKVDHQSSNNDFKDFDILVNTTPLGMKGKFESETPVTAKQIENVHLVYDLVYNPFETRLIKEARQSNVPTIGGLAMLVAQGMKQFEIWTNLEAPMKVMSAAALRKL